MPGIQDTVSVPANGQVDNVIAGSQFEYLPYDCELEIGVQGAVTGLRVDIYSGLDVLAENYAVPLQNRFPIYPDDFAFSDFALAGERLKIRFRNTTPAAIIAFWNVKVAPVG